jgi:hypothetical protein
MRRSKRREVDWPCYGDDPRDALLALSEQWKFAYRALHRGFSRVESSPESRSERAFWHREANVTVLEGAKITKPVDRFAKLMDGSRINRASWQLVVRADSFSRRPSKTDTLLGRRQKRLITIEIIIVSVSQDLQQAAVFDEARH